MLDKDITEKYQAIRKAQDERDQMLGDEMDRTVKEFREQIEALVLSPFSLSLTPLALQSCFTDSPLEYLTHNNVNPENTDSCSYSTTLLKTRILTGNH